MLKLLRRSVFSFSILFLWVFAIKAESPPQMNILILGDSLTEGYGIEKEMAFPALLEKKFHSLNPTIHVINGGSSGSTSASALKRLQWYAKGQPDWILLTIGSNDGLRGVPIEQTRKNIENTIRFAQAQHYKVLLAGLKVPPNYGPAYAKAFENIFSSLAQQYNIPLLPFLLEGVAGERKLNQADGIHPNEAGHARIAENIFLFLKGKILAK